MVAAFNQGCAYLTAVHAASFERTAALDGAFFVDQTAEEALEGLRSDPSGLLVAADTADDLSVEEGAEVHVLLARGTDQQALEPFRVVAPFERLPGWPLVSPRAGRRPPGGRCRRPRRGACGSRSGIAPAGP